MISVCKYRESFVLVCIGLNICEFNGFYNWLMGKKQSKRGKLKTKQSQQHREQMKNIMTKLSQTKKKNQVTNTKLLSITSINKLNKKIKKKAICNDKLPNQQANLNEPQQDQVLNEHCKPINIFQIAEYDTGKKVSLQPHIEAQIQQENLQAKAKRLVGGDYTTDKFGSKPLRVIENIEKIQMEEEEKAVSHPDLATPVGNTIFARKNSIQDMRKALPIYMQEQQIIETINNNLVTLICGETGSGKSTQVPQFLLEKNYIQLGKIAITQPRRLATLALAQRVAEELNEKVGGLVSYQVRHEKKESEHSHLKFMTDGILLNLMHSDFLLSNYSVVIIDEAHERKVNTDLLIGLLSRVILIRYEMFRQGKGQPLRLVIMSATMRVEDFSNRRLFNFEVPIMHIEAKMFPVTIFHQKHTPENYLQSALKKCLRIHHRLPEGNVLVFLTGKDQIHQLAALLEQQLQNGTQDYESSGEEFSLPEGRVCTKFTIHKLYSSMPMHQQKEIFRKTQEGQRKFIISTNIAETSITIPNVRYVIDSGQQKHRYYEGVWKWRKGWGSQAMAEQRAGRAGRTAHGYCYRLYSSALYANIMEKYPATQISKQPLQNVILQVKSIGIENIFQFPFPTVPEPQKIVSALHSLHQIKAIEGVFSEGKDQSSITELGKVLSFIPLDPKLSKMLLLGRTAHIEKHILYITILLTSQSIFNQNFISQNALGKQQSIEELRSNKSLFREKYKNYLNEQKYGDIFAPMNIVGQFFMRIIEQRKVNSHKAVQKVVASQSKQLDLNINTMRELYFNADQICQIYETISGNRIDMSHYERPTQNQLSDILNILLHLNIDNLCRIEQKNKYKDAKDAIVYVNHLSGLYMKNHLFLGCCGFQESKNGKRYMQYPFTVPNYELLAQYGQVRAPNDYAWKNGSVVGLTTGRIYSWQIPNLEIKNPCGDGKYYWAARQFLEGEVFPSLKALSKYLVAQPNLIKLDSIDYKVQKLVEALRTHSVCSKKQWIQLFCKDKHYLKEQLKLWLKVNDFESIYGKVRQSIIEGGERQ